VGSIQVVGHLTVDITPGLTTVVVPPPGVLAEVGPAVVTLGGAVGNCGRALAQLGADAYVAGAVGDDALGRLVAEVLEGQLPGRVDLVVDPERATGSSIVIEEPGLDRSYWHHPGANATYTLECPIRADGIVHMGYPPLMAGTCAGAGEPVAALFARAHRAGCATSLDLAYVADDSPVRAIDWSALLDRLAPETDVLCPSGDDLARLGELTGTAALCAGVESAATHLVERGAAVVLVTAGAAGAYLRTGPRAALDRLSSACGIDASAWADRSEWAGAPKLARVRTASGAGDTYKAALLVALCRGDDPGSAMAYAAGVSGRYLAGDGVLGPGVLADPRGT